MNVKQAVLVGVAAALIVWPAGLWAQGTFPLKYVEAGPDDQLITSGMRITGGMAIPRPSSVRVPKVARPRVAPVAPGEPTAPGSPSSPSPVPPRPPTMAFATPSGGVLQLKTAPAGLSDKARSYLLSFGDRHFFAIVDPASPPKLYLGAAGSGDLSTAAPINGTVHEGACVFSSVVLPPTEGKGGAAIKLRLMTFNEGQLLAMCPAGYFSGEVVLGGRTYRVALVDANGNGLVSDVSGLSGDGKEWRGQDRLAIDLNQDGRFSWTPQAPEIQWLCKTLRVRDVYYSVQVAPDASSIRLDEVKPRMGTLDLGGADVSLVLVSEMGVHALHGGGGKWALPEGEYLGRSLSLWKSDGAGQKWTLGDLSACGPLRRFTVRAGDTAAIKVGPPLALKAEAKSGGADQVILSVWIEGCGGEQYSVGLSKAGAERMPAPKVKVLDDGGKTLAEGNSEYG